MRREGGPVVPIDPMATTAAMMNLWRTTTFDIPFAYALYVNECMKRMFEQQCALMAYLAKARDVKDVAAAQAEFVEAAIDDMEESAATLARDVAVTLETARAS
ncbi:MAG: hypothetical protein EA385_01455 [Salinarimonadaceae bacterium]|nr:MAG: hypothetical protein EA385_01455 [Salinarimonadaceae bacterium]